MFNLYFDQAVLASGLGLGLQINLQICGFLSRSARLSILLETSTETKNKAELLAAERGEWVEYFEKKAERSEALRHSEDDFAKQNIKCQKEEISKLTILLRDLETKTAKKLAKDSASSLTVRVMMKYKKKYPSQEARSIIM